MVGARKLESHSCRILVPLFSNVISLTGLKLSSVHLNYNSLVTLIYQIKKIECNFSSNEKNMSKCLNFDWFTIFELLSSFLVENYHFYIFQV